MQVRRRGLGKAIYVSLTTTLKPTNEQNLGHNDCYRKRILHRHVLVRIRAVEGTRTLFELLT